MSAFELDHAEDMKDPEYAYEFGRNERELEIIKLLEDSEKLRGHIYFWQEFGENDTEGRDRKALAIALIKGEK